FSMRTPGHARRARWAGRACRCPMPSCAARTNRPSRRCGSMTMRCRRRRLPRGWPRRSRSRAGSLAKSPSKSCGAWSIGFATAHRIEKLLTAAIVLALLGTILVGYLWGRSFIQRIFALTRVTRSIADGKLDTRVTLSGHDEIRELGDAFNSMADKLVELQEN